MRASSRCRFRVFGTTADMGFSVSAPGLPELFACAGEGLFSAVCDRRLVRGATTREVTVNGDSCESLMVAWLNELICMFDTDGFLARRMKVKMTGEKRLSAVLTGETYDPERHTIGTAFKAATYHKLSVRRRGGIWRASVVLDV